MNIFKLVKVGKPIISQKNNMVVNRISQIIILLKFDAVPQTSFLIYDFYPLFLMQN
jgi:hypothetical protein